MRRPPRAQPARHLAREASEQPAWRSVSPRREAKGLPPRSAKTPRSFSNAEIRRQRGGARICFTPSGRKGRSRVRPVLADSAARPARPIPPKSTNIFLEISRFHFPFFAPSRTEYSPSLASLGSPLSEGAGRAADATRERRPPRVLRRSPRALRSPPRAQPAPLREGGGAKRRGEYSVRRLPRALRSPLRAQPARRPARRRKPQNGPRGGVPALDAKRKGCLRVRPSLLVPFPTRSSGDNAEIRRQRGGARNRFAPPGRKGPHPLRTAGRKGRSRARPVLADSAPSRTAHSTKIYVYFS